MCASVGIVFYFLIVATVIVVLFLLFKLWGTAILSKLGEPGSLVVQSINIIIWGALIIFCLYLLWDLVECLIGPGGFHFPSPRR